MKRWNDISETCNQASLLKSETKKKLWSNGNSYYHSTYILPETYFYVKKETNHHGASPICLGFSRRVVVDGRLYRTPKIFTQRIYIIYKNFSDYMHYLRLF